MTKEPCGSIATRQALRMLGVSAAEIPHILHVSFSRLLRDCRFLLLSRILQSGMTAQAWAHGRERETRLHVLHSRAKCVYLAARRGPFYPSARWPPSTAETSPAPGPGTSPTASASQPVSRCHFSCELCKNKYSSTDASTRHCSSLGAFNPFSYLLGTSMLMMQVSSSSPCWSVQEASSQRWSWDRQ